MVDPHLALVAIGVVLTLWIGGAIGHGLKKAGHVIKHVGEKIVHVTHK